MRIKIGTGNDITVTFAAAAKTLAFAGAYNFDIEPENLIVWNTTRSAFMIGNTSTVTGTVATTWSGGLPIQTVTLSAVPASSADGDTLVILVECPDSVALYNAVNLT